jgi:hypothetical protein
MNEGGCKELQPRKTAPEIHSRDGDRAISMEGEVKTRNRDSDHRRTMERDVE